MNAFGNICQDSRGRSPRPPWVEVHSASQRCRYLFAVYQRRVFHMHAQWKEGIKLTGRHAEGQTRRGIIRSSNAGDLFQLLPWVGTEKDRVVQKHRSWHRVDTETGRLNWRVVVVLTAAGARFKRLWKQVSEKGGCKKAGSKMLQRKLCRKLSHDAQVRPRMRTPIKWKTSRASADRPAESPSGHGQRQWIRKRMKSGAGRRRGGEARSRPARCMMTQHS